MSDETWIPITVIGPDGRRYASEILNGATFDQLAWHLAERLGLEPGYLYRIRGGGPLVPGAVVEITESEPVPVRVPEIADMGPWTAPR